MTEKEIVVLPKPFYEKLNFHLCIHPNLKELKKLIEENNIDVNGYLENENFNTMLIKIVSPAFFDHLDEKLLIVNYLLKKGANPNVRNKKGTFPLEVSVEFEKFIPIAITLIENGADVNMVDRQNKNTPLFAAIKNYPKLFEVESEENIATQKKWQTLVEFLLSKGANINQANKHGITARVWLEGKSEQLTEVIEKYEKLKPEYISTEPIPVKFPTDLKYPDVAAKIWKELVPAKGQSETLQGELLRCIEKLRWEAQENGNLNWDEDFKSMIKLIDKTLCKTSYFTHEIKSEIKKDVTRLLKFNIPYLKDDIYDRLTDRICEFYIKEPKLLDNKSIFDR